MAPAYKFSNGAFELWLPGEVGYNPANPFRNSQAFYFLPSADEWYKAAFYEPLSGEYFDNPTGNDMPPTPTTGGTDADTAVYSQSPLQGPADVMRAGGMSPYGTVGQGGNVWEWMETESDMVNDSVESPRQIRGGSWFSLNVGSTVRSSLHPSDLVSSGIGFRVASVPEPSGIALGGLAAICLVTMRRMQRIDLLIGSHVAAHPLAVWRPARP